MAKDDYHADLDAINLMNRLKRGRNLQEVMSTYYVGIQNGTINRATEFATNMGNGNYENGMSVLKEERELARINYMGQYLTTCTPQGTAGGCGIYSDKDQRVAEKYAEDRLSTADQFLNNLGNHSNEW